MDDGVEDYDVDDIGTGDGGGKPAAAAIARRGSRRSMAVSSSTTLTPGSSPSQVMEALQAGATPMPQSVQELATETEAMTKEVPMRCCPAKRATNIININITIVAVVPRLWKWRQLLQQGEPSWKKPKLLQLRGLKSADLSSHPQPHWYSFAAVLLSHTNECSVLTHCFHQVDAIHKKRMQELADAARAVQGRDQQVRGLEATPASACTRVTKTIFLCNERCRFVGWRRKHCAPSTCLGQHGMHQFLLKPGATLQSTITLR